LLVSITAETENAAHKYAVDLKFAFTCMHLVNILKVYTVDGTPVIMSCLFTTVRGELYDFVQIRIS